MSEHTERRLYYHKTDRGAEYLCTKPVTGTREGDMSHAAVRLDGEPVLLYRFAAAPKLLESCKAALAAMRWARDNRTTLNPSPEWCNAWDGLKKAIAKAEGSTE